MSDKMYFYYWPFAFFLISKIMNSREICKIRLSTIFSGNFRLINHWNDTDSFNGLEIILQIKKCPCTNWCSHNCYLISFIFLNCTLPFFAEYLFLELVAKYVIINNVGKGRNLNVIFYRTDFNILKLNSSLI